VFARRLREMDAKAKAGLGEALKSASAPGVVRSAFDLPAEQRTMIQDAINETFSADIHIRFETAPDLVSGIELATDGQKVGWSIAEYLASLEKGVEELLQEKEKDQAQAQAQAKSPSDLTRRIGKRAYELYEEHGRKDGLAAQDWKTAESEIRKEISNPVTSEPAPEAKAEPKPEANAEPEPKETAEPKPEVKAEPKPEPEAEPKPEAKSGPASEEPKREAQGQ